MSTIVTTPDACTSQFKQELQRGLVYVSQAHNGMELKMTFSPGTATHRDFLQLAAFHCCAGPSQEQKALRCRTAACSAPAFPAPGSWRRCRASPLTCRSRRWRREVCAYLHFTKNSRILEKQSFDTKQIIAFIDSHVLETPV